jgi:curved DNA-binding protein CbpA
MTREEALQNLNLPPDADSEAVEKAYQRLVRRYPPEFHPEKFRILDESYRHLTSLAAMIEKLLAPAIEDSKLDPALIAFEPSIPESRLEEALDEIRTLALEATLWKSPAAKQQHSGNGARKASTRGGTAGGRKGSSHDEDGDMIPF